MENLSFFENEYPPVFKVCCKTKSNYMLEFAEFLKDFWKKEVSKVVESVYKIMEPSTYCEVSILFRVPLFGFLILFYFRL